MTRSGKSLYEEILEEWDALVLLILSVGGILADTFLDLPEGLISTLVLLIVIAISVRQIRTSIKSEKMIEKGQEEIKQEFQQLLENDKSSRLGLSDQNRVIINNLDRVRETLLSQKSHEAAICDQRNFYVHLTDALSRVQFTVDLTQLDAAPPSAYGLPEKIDYFNLSTRTVIEKPHVRFRRIVAIPNFEKLAWVRQVLEQVKNNANFNLHYVDIATEKFFMPPLSIQIIDRKELCMVDPTRGFLPIAGGDKSLWIRSDSICEIFSEYYEKFWIATVPVKEGGIIYWDVLDKIEQTLSIH